MNGVTDIEAVIDNATDESMRALLLNATLGLFVGDDYPIEYANEAVERAGQLFDGWLAKRDMDIYDQAYAHGFVEGSGE